MTRHDGRIGAAVPVFRVASVARSMVWYEDVLGFSPDPVGPPDDPSFAILRRDGVELMLQRVRAGVGGPRSATIAGGGWDVYIRVDDLQRLYDAIRTKVPGVGPIAVRVYGCKEFELADPDGHMVVFGQCG
jgi:catechol 2,3-dioxygenase-like lactoylglutathione lyase family enzyme